MDPQLICLTISIFKESTSTLRNPFLPFSQVMYTISVVLMKLRQTMYAYLGRNTSNIQTGST